MGDIALIIFTICVQAAIGLMAFVAIAMLMNKADSYKAAIVTAAGLAVVGLLASLLHLGQPLSALNSLAKFGTSWLSREIWFTGTFTGLTLVCALLIFFKPTARSAVKALVPLAALIGLADVYVMASIYSFTSVPAWQHGSIYIEFYAATISMGAILFLLLNNVKMYKITAFATGGAIVLQVTSMILYYIALGTSDNPAAQQSLALLNEMSLAMIIKWVFILVGAGLLLIPITANPAVSLSTTQSAAETAATGKETVSYGLYAAATLLIIGQIAGRYLFYAVMIINRTGLN